MTLSEITEVHIGAVDFYKDDPVDYDFLTASVSGREQWRRLFLLGGVVWMGGRIGSSGSVLA